jgi:methylated-DNA-[protein]-cysteine S-methyltransferase
MKAENEIAVAKRIKTPLGDLVLAANNRGLISCAFASGKVSPSKKSITCPATRVLARAEKVLRDYFRGNTRGLGAVPVAPRGTEFQRRVWRVLQSIEPGATLSYSAVARKAGSPRAARAVGQACNRNPIALFIPCHRVVGADAKLTGYAGGLNRKAKLLKLERRS